MLRFHWDLHTHQVFLEGRHFVSAQGKQFGIGGAVCKYGVSLLFLLQRAETQKWGKSEALLIIEHAQEVPTRPLHHLCMQQN